LAASRDPVLHRLADAVRTDVAVMPALGARYSKRTAFQEARPGDKFQPSVNHRALIGVSTAPRWCHEGL
jgi:hypothetical protein